MFAYVKLEETERCCGVTLLPNLLQMIKISAMNVAQLSQHSTVAANKATFGYEGLNALN